MKNVNLLAVKYAALLLIERNEKTTTLEVKKLLRHVGYYAEQEEVSIFMEQAALELPLEWTDVYHPVTHREYTMPENPTVTASDDHDDNDDDDVPVGILFVDDLDDDLDDLDFDLDDDAYNLDTYQIGDLDEHEQSIADRIRNAIARVFGVDLEIQHSTVRDFYESLNTPPETDDPNTDDPVISDIVDTADSETDDGDEGDAPEMSYLSQVTPRLRDAADFEYTTKLGDTILLFRHKAVIVNNGGHVYRMTSGAAGEFFFCQDISRDLARSAHAGVTPDTYNEVRSTSDV